MKQNRIERYDEKLMAAGAACLTSKIPIPAYEVADGLGPGLALFQTAYRVLKTRPINWFPASRLRGFGLFLSLITVTY